MLLIKSLGAGFCLCLSGMAMATSTLEGQLVEHNMNQLSSTHIQMSDNTRRANRLDRRGDKIDYRLERKGDRINNRLDRRAERAAANGHEKRAKHLDRKGNRIENRLERRGDRINNRLDRRADRVGRR